MVCQFGKGKIDASRLINLMTDNLNCKNEYQSSKSDYYSDSCLCSMSAYVKPECDRYLRRFYDGMGYGYYDIGEEYTVFCTAGYNAAENKS